MEIPLQPPHTLIHLQWIIQIFPFKLSSPGPLLWPNSQLYQTLPGNLQDTLTIEASRTSAWIYHSLHCPKSTPHPSLISSSVAVFLLCPLPILFFYSQGTNYADLVEHHAFFSPLNSLSPTDPIPNSRCQPPITRNTFFLRKLVPTSIKTLEDCPTSNTQLPQRKQKPRNNTVSNQNLEKISVPISTISLVSDA